MINDPLIYGIVVSVAMITACICWKCTPIRSATFDDE